MTPASSSATSSSTSGIMYGTTMPTSPIRPSTTARPTTPAVDSGCHAAAHVDQPRGSLAVDPSADVEHDEQHGGEHGHAADEAPARTQEQFVEPVAPAAALVRRAEPGRGFEQRGRAMVAVGVQLVRQRTRQRLRGAREQPPHFRQISGKVLLHFVEKIRIALRDLRHEQLRRHAEGLLDLRRAQQRRERLRARR